MPFLGSAWHAVVELRAGAAALLATTLILAGIALAARLAGRASRTATRVLCAIPVVSAALGIAAIASDRPDPLTFILLLSCAAVMLALARVQGRRLSRHMKAAQDNLRRAHLILRRAADPDVHRAGLPHPPGHQLPDDAPDAPLDGKHGTSAPSA